MRTVSVRPREYPAGDRVTTLADMTKSRFLRAAPARHDEPLETGGCAVPGCRGEATHKAPRSRRELDRYVWFCLDHVRAYNASWDYYAGMDEGEIEAHRRADVTWRRPTWPLGGRAPGRQPGRNGAWDTAFDDPFGLFGGRAESGGAAPERPPSKTGRALEVLDLRAPVTAHQVKARYIELVKRFHPDANGGDKTAEERLKLVNDAYTTLKNSVGPHGSTH